MPPKKKASKPKDATLKIGKAVFKSPLAEHEKALIDELGKKVNLNGFRWELGIFTLKQ